MKKIFELIFCFLIIVSFGSCEDQTITDINVSLRSDTVCYSTNLGDSICVVTNIDTVFNSNDVPDTTGNLSSVMSDDLLLVYQWGQSNVSYPASNDSIPFPYKDSLITTGSSSFIWNAHWPTSYIYSTGSFGNETSYIFKMDSIYPGQIRIVRHQANGTRLRTNTLTPSDPGFRYDWNVNSINENWDRSINFAFGRALQKLKDENPTKNIRFISVVAIQTESDSSLEPLAGDSTDMTNDQARDTYVQDMKALYADMLFVADSIGIDTTEVQLQLVETGPGVNVLNRPLNSGIREAQDLLDQQINRCIIIHTDGLNILDGVHYSPSGHIELGKRLANNDLARFQ